MCLSHKWLLILLLFLGCVFGTINPLAGQSSLSSYSVDTIGGHRLFKQPFGPTGIAIQQDKHLLVTDASKNEVLVFDLKGKYLRSFGKTNDATTNLKSPFGIAVSPEGKIVVADTGNHRVQMFDASGKFLRMFGHEGERKGELLSPRGVAIAPSGNIIVADTNNNRVQIFDADGKFLTKFGSAASREAHFEGDMDRPYAVAVTTSGKIIVADANNSRVQIFDAEGKFLKAFGSEGDQEGQFAPVLGGRENETHGIWLDPQALFAVAVSPSGKIFVTDTGNHRIQVFDSEGNYISKIGKKGKRKGQFQGKHSLLGIAFSQAGDLFVTDAGNSRIQIFRKVSPLSE